MKRSHATINGSGVFFSPKPISRESVVSIKNLTRRYTDDEGQSWECGHVKTNGSMCLGNEAFEFLFKAFVDHDVEYDVETLVRFVTTPNESDEWDEHMCNWPAVN